MIHSSLSIQCEYEPNVIQLRPNWYKWTSWMKWTCRHVATGKGIRWSPARSDPYSDWMMSPLPNQLRTTSLNLRMYSQQSEWAPFPQLMLGPKFGTPPYKDHSGNAQFHDDWTLRLWSHLPADCSAVLLAPNGNEHTMILSELQWLWVYKGLVRPKTWVTEASTSSQLYLVRHINWLCGKAPLIKWMTAHHGHIRLT